MAGRPDVPTDSEKMWTERIENPVGLKSLKGQCQDAWLKHLSQKEGVDLIYIDHLPLEFGGNGKLKTNNLLKVDSYFLLLRQIKTELCYLLTFLV